MVEDVGWWLWIKMTDKVTDECRSVQVSAVWEIFGFLTTAGNKGQRGRKLLTSRTENVDNTVDRRPVQTAETRMEILFLWALINKWSVVSQAPPVWYLPEHQWSYMWWCNGVWIIYSTVDNMMRQMKEVWRLYADNGSSSLWELH